MYTSTVTLVDRQHDVPSSIRDTCGMDDTLPISPGVVPSYLIYLMAT